MDLKLNISDFSKILAQPPEFTKNSFFANVLHDAYLVIFNKYDFNYSKVIVPNTNWLYTDFQLNPSEHTQINDILNSIDKMLQLANMATADESILGSNNFAFILETAIQKIYKNIQQKSNKRFKRKPTHKMPTSNIRRSFKNQVGSTPEKIYAASVFYLFEQLYNYIQENNLTECLAITINITKLSFLMSKNRNSVIGGKTKNALIA